MKTIDMRGKVLFGHPTGNPNAYQAGLAHFESGRLEAFCVPWMLTPPELNVLRRVPILKSWSRRLERRFFPPLLPAPRIEDRFGEWKRLAKRTLSNSPEYIEALAYEANDWLMNVMARDCARETVTVVHSYEDCSLRQFETAKRLGKICVYDMPIGYYPAWQEAERKLTEQFRDWLSPVALRPNQLVRPDQKLREMELADLVFVPSNFAKETVVQFVDKKCSLASYGVDFDFWQPPLHERAEGPMRFIYAGQVNVRKGIPTLLEAWVKAGLREAELLLVGVWQLSQDVLKSLPSGVRHIPACSAGSLRDLYQSADMFVFPSFFEGFGLVLLEAMSCGLPVLSSECCAAPDFVTSECGSIIPAGDLDAWVEALVSANVNRSHLPAMRTEARRVALENSWPRYRRSVSTGVASIPA
jgi:glycosyltransferase involved in cell wall biosynthesis